MPYYSNELIQQIKEANDIVEVISQYVPLKKRGRNYIACCPFHNEKTPSFTVDPQRKFYYCFGCHEKGNVFSFLQKKENISFPEAVQQLARRANIPLPTTENKFAAKKAKENQAIYAINAKAGEYFFENLKRSNVALGYLVDRGISSETIKEFGLGYSLNDWDDLKNKLLENGESEPFLIKAGLIRSNGKRSYDLFRDRLMIPIQNVYNKIIAFGGRQIHQDDKSPKYLNTPDTPVFNKKNQLFNLNRAKSEIREGALILVEGYMDVIALYSYGIKNVAAALGTAFTPEHVKLISRYTKSVILCFDGDSAGEKATDRALEILSDSDLNIKVIRLPKEHDPDTYIRDNGLDAFNDQIKYAQPANDYKLSRIKSNYNLSNSEDIIAFISECCSFIKHLGPVEQEIYLKKVSEISGISLETIKKELDRVNKIVDTKPVRVQSQVNKSVKSPIKQKVRKPIPRELVEAQNIFLSYSYFNPEFITESKVNEFMLRGKFYKWLFLQLRDLNQTQPTVSELINNSEAETYNEALKQFLIKLKRENLNTVQTAVDVIRKYHRQREITQLIQDLQGESMNNEANLFDRILDLRKVDWEEHE